MKSLAVCGDSWFSSDINMPNMSFGEIVATKNNCDLLSLARCGCSNFVVGLQVDMAIRSNVDFVILGACWVDRIDIPIINNNIWKNLIDNFSWRSWFRLQPGVYKEERGLANIQYSPHPDLSSQNPLLINPVVVSESINNLAFDQVNSEYYNLSQNQKQALQSYMLNLYDYGIKQQQDVWLINDACRRLLAANIPFLIFTEALYNTDYYRKSIEWIPKKYRIDNSDFQLYNLKKTNATRFHYLPELGNKIADYIQTRLINF